MGYGLGVDLGTTYSAAATSDGSEPAMLGLGNRALQIPSVIYVQADGSMLVGEPAERRGAADPTHVIREFKRRIGDPVPILVGGMPYSPQVLTSRLLRWVVEQAGERMGAPPDWIVLTHPANWSRFKLELLHEAAKLADLPDVTLCPEPVAAALRYASGHRVQDGERICVYDLGGGTFDVCILAKEPTGFRILGSPEGIEHLGGIDFDETVFRRVLDGLPIMDNPAAMDDLTGLARLRRDCVDAKEALSTDVETVVPVSMGGNTTTVRLTRAEFEDLIQPALSETVAATHRAIRSAGITPADISTLVLVGGSSRIPIITEILSGEFRRPVARNTHPKHDVALGAAIAGSQRAAARVTDRRPPGGHVPADASQVVAAAGVVPGTTYQASGPPPPPDSSRGWGAPGTAPPPPASGPSTGPPRHQMPRRGRPSPSAEPRRPPGRLPRRAVIAFAAAGAVVAIAVTVFLLTRADGGTTGQSSTDSTTSAPSSAVETSVSSAVSTSAPPDLPRSAEPLADSVVISPRVINSTMDLYAVDSVDGRARQLTTTRGTAEGPTISPDRRTVVYMAIQPDGGAVLRAVGADGTDDRPLFEQAPEGCERIMYRPAWNPVDPEQLALNCADAQGTFTLRIIGVDGAVVRTLTVGQEMFDDLTFSPDGSTLAFWAGPASGKGSGSIFTMPADGSAPPTRITDGGTGTDADPVFSPDGEHIVFRRIVDGTTRRNTELFVVRPDGSDLRPLASHEGDDQDPTWSPDGTQIAFNSTRGDGEVDAGINHVLIMTSDGQDIRRLAPANPFPEQSAPGWGHR